MILAKITGDIVRLTPPTNGDAMKNKIARTRKFVSDHRVAIAVTTTLTLCLMLQLRNAKILNAFLEEHNLLDEYYQPEDE